MPPKGVTYGLVDWFIKKLDFDLKDYIDDETKDKIKDQSSQEFFEKGMDIAISGTGSSEKKESLRKLKKNISMESSGVGTISTDPKFIDNLDEFFEAKLKDMVERADLPEKNKENLVSVIPKIDDKEVFREEINQQIKEVKELGEKRAEEIRAEKEVEVRETLRIERSERRRVLKEAREVGEIETRRVRGIPTEVLEAEIEEIKRIEGIK